MPSTLLTRSSSVYVLPCLLSLILYSDYVNSWGSFLPWVFTVLIMNVTERHDQGSFMQLDKLSIKITDQKQSKVKPACRFQPRNISSWPIWSVTPPEATRFYLLVPLNTQWCVFFCSLYYRVRTCYHQILASLSGLPKLALVLLLLLKLGQHCQTTHTGSSDQFVFLLSLLLFFFFGSSGDSYCDHILRKAKPCPRPVERTSRKVCQEVHCGSKGSSRQAANPSAHLGLEKEMLQALMVLLFT